MITKVKNKWIALSQMNIKKSYAFMIVVGFSALCTFLIFSLSEIFFTDLEVKTYKPVSVFLPLMDHKLAYPLSAKEKSIYLQDSQAQVMAGIGSNFFRLPITHCDNGLGHRRVFCRVGYYIYEILDRSQSYLKSKDQKNSLASVLENYANKNSEAAVAAGISAGIMHLSAQEMISLMSDKKDTNGLKNFVDGWAYYQYSQEKIEKNIHSFCKSNVTADLISYCEWGAGRALYVYQDVYLPSLAGYAGSSALDGYLFSKAFEDFIPAVAGNDVDNNMGETIAAMLKKIFYQAAGQLNLQEKNFVHCINANIHIMDCGQHMAAGL